MTEQDKKLLKVYDLLGSRIINKLDYLNYIVCEFDDIDDELKIKLANKLEQAYLHAHNDVPIYEIAQYMYWKTQDENNEEENRISIDELLSINDRDLGNSAFEWYYMSI